MTDTRKSKIIVGVDGSESSLDALRWAARQAGLTGAVLEAVCAWDYPTDAVWSGMASYLPPDFDAEGSAKENLAESIEKALGADAGKDVVRVVANGPAATVLLEQAKGAELLVIGDRGYGPVRSSLLGSVGHAVIHHAHCPVVVVRTEPKGSEA